MRIVRIAKIKMSLVILFIIVYLENIYIYI